MDIRYYVTKKEILKEAGKNTLKFLHDGVGFDYEKPIIMSKIDGNFTLKKVWSIIPHINYDYKLVVLIRNTHTFNKNRFHAIIAKSEESFEIEIKTTYYDWQTRPDTFFRKSDFNNLRKKNDTETYIIAQKKEYLLQPVKYVYTVRTLKDNVRYSIHNKSYTYYAENKGKYLSYMELVETGKQGKSIQFDCPVIRQGDKNIITVSSLLDASGYYVFNRRQELKRRANALRAEREKAAYMVTDETERINQAKSYAADAKRHIIETLEKAETYDTVYSVHRNVYELAWLYRDIEQFAEYAGNKKYNSKEHADKNFNRIVEQYEKIVKGGTDHA